MSQKLHLGVGDRVFAYFIGDDDVRTRRFTVTGIYATNMKRFDDLVCLTDLYATQRLNGWSGDECTGAELLVDDFSRLEQTSLNVVWEVGRTLDAEGNTFASQNILEAYPQIFSWLDLLDVNVWIILALMVAVAGFTMISGLLIIILERTQMIGILKALGTRNKTIRHTFLWFSVFIIGQGMLWGNILGIGLVLLQQYTGIVSLDPQVYYVSEAPVELNLPLIALLNLVTLLVCVFVLIAPSYLVSHIQPAKSMRYE
jgi:lipoprotein-releasing system permease protein